MSQEILEGVNATRMELLALKERLDLAKRGYELLKKKLETLTAELFNILNRYKEMSTGIQDILAQALQHLSQTEMTLGPSKVKELSYLTPETFIIEMQSHNLMGVPVPVFNVYEKETMAPVEEGLPERKEFPYPLLETNATFDEAVEAFQKALLAIVRLAEVQSSLIRVASEIADTKRRVNALNYIIVPRIENTIAWIRLSLAEQERESFVRLKKVKKKLERKAEEA